ncbi:hypothetical protein D3C83_43030 [compost metagenome]
MGHDVDGRIGEEFGLLQDLVGKAQIARFLVDLGHDPAIAAQTDRDAKERELLFQDLFVAFFTCDQDFHRLQCSKEIIEF